MKSKIINYGTNNRYPEAVIELTERISFYKRHKDLIRLINANFVIRVYKYQEGKKIKTLVGGGQITKYMKEEDAIKQFQTCLNGQRSKYT